MGAHREALEHVPDQPPDHVSAKTGGNTMKTITLAALAASTMLVAGVALAQQQPDWNAIQIKTTDLGNKTYMLEGQGGNITVAVGTDGIIMVDGQFAPLSDKIKAAIKAISPLPIKYMINTHFHGDHTGGNDNFAKDGVTIVAHDNIRLRLAKRADVAEYREMLLTSRDRIERLVREGKTEQEVVALKPLADLDAKWAATPEAAVNHTRNVYNSFKRL